MKTLYPSRSVAELMYAYLLSVADVAFALLIMMSLCSTSLIMLYVAVGVI